MRCLCVLDCTAFSGNGYADGFTKLESSRDFPLGSRWLPQNRRLPWLGSWSGQAKWSQVRVGYCRLWKIWLENQAWTNYLTVMIHPNKIKSEHKLIPSKNWFAIILIHPIVTKNPITITIIGCALASTIFGIIAWAITPWAQNERPLLRQGLCKWCVSYFDPQTLYSESHGVEKQIRRISGRYLWGNPVLLRLGRLPWSVWGQHARVKISRVVKAQRTKCVCQKQGIVFPPVLPCAQPESQAGVLVSTWRDHQVQQGLGFGRDREVGMK